LIFTTVISTPIGFMQLASTDEGICLTEFIETENTVCSNLKKISSLLKLDISNTKNNYLNTLEKEFEKYFQSNLFSFSVPLHFIGTDFQKKVWNQLLKIEIGYTITYKQQSIDMQNPLAIRAIASANGQNKIAIIVPCHRVIGTNGKLVGYAAGMHRKKWLLQHEGVLGREMIF
jgi:O-6-methylguanine DNA methyltransferase